MIGLAPKTRVRTGVVNPNHEIEQRERPRSSHATSHMTSMIDPDPRSIMRFSNTILPTRDAVFDIGSPEFRVRSLYVSDHSLHIGCNTITNTDDGTRIRFIDARGEFLPILSGDAEVHGDLTVDGELRVNQTFFAYSNVTVYTSQEVRCNYIIASRPPTPRSRTCAPRAPSSWTWTIAADSWSSGTALAISTFSVSGSPQSTRSGTRPTSSPRTHSASPRLRAAAVRPRSYACITAGGSASA